jgi:hypothetical protein
MTVRDHHQRHKPGKKEQGERHPIRISEAKCIKQCLPAERSNED